MKIRLLPIAITILSGALLCGCASTGGPAPPNPIDAQSAGLCMSLKMRQGPLKMTSETPDVVLFVHLAEGETVGDVVEKRYLIPSTWVDKEQVYIFNLEPGTYAAVAAIYGVEQEPTEIHVASTNIGSNVKVSFDITHYGEDTYRNYFSEELVAETVTTVEPGEVAFMGRFVTNQSTSFGGGDPVQEHFLRVVEGEGADKSGFSKMMSGDYSRRLDTHEIERGEEQRQKFMKNARKYVGGTAWAAALDGQ